MTGDSDFHIGKASIVAVVGLLIGIASSIIYLGGSLRQIEVNGSRITDLQRQMEKHDEALQAQLRPREFWEGLAAELATLKARLECGLRHDKATGTDS